MAHLNRIQDFSGVREVLTWCRRMIVSGLYLQLGRITAWSRIRCTTPYFTCCLRVAALVCICEYSAGTAVGIAVVRAGLCICRGACGHVVEAVRAPERIGYPAASAVVIV